MLRPYAITTSDLVPRPHIPNLINSHIRQPGIPEHFRDARAPRCFRAGRRGDRGQRRLAGERRLVRALDVRAGGAQPGVRKQRIQRGEHDGQTMMSFGAVAT